MINELIQELYIGFRQFVGSGAVTVLYIAAVLTLVVVFAGKCKSVIPAALSVLGTIGCAASEFIDGVMRKYHERTFIKTLTLLFAAGLCLLVAASSGKSVFSPDLSERTTNAMHLPEGFAEAADAVLSDEKAPVVITMPEWGEYLKCYSSSFTLIHEGSADTELSKVHPDMRKVASAARRNGCGYIILSNDIWPDVPITRFGYDLVYENGTCSVYREVNTP